MNENAALSQGQRIADRYIIESLIGFGGYGDVYRATQISTGQSVAIKVLSRQGKTHYERRVARFYREMALIAQLHHSYIVKLLDSGELENGLLFMVLEFIEGKTLRRTIEHNGSLPKQEALRLMTQVMEAIAAAHAKGVVHRDLKPANIMISSVGQRKNALVLDFGIATLVSTVNKSDLPEGNDFAKQAITHTGELQGTPAYMAPEQLQGKACEASDIYAWGLIFIECLTGKQVILEEYVADAIVVQLSDAPIILPDIEDPVLYQILKKATRKPLTERYACAEDVLKDLDQCFLPIDSHNVEQNSAEYQENGITISETQLERNYSKEAFDETMDFVTPAAEDFCSIEFSPSLTQIETFPIKPFRSSAPINLHKTTQTNPKVSLHDVPVLNPAPNKIRPTSGEHILLSPIKQAAWFLSIALCAIFIFLASSLIPFLLGGDGLSLSQGLPERAFLSVVGVFFLLKATRETQVFWQTCHWNSWIHGLGTALLPLFGIFLASCSIFYNWGVRGLFNDILFGNNTITPSIAHSIESVIYDGKVQFYTVSNISFVLCGIAFLLLIFSLQTSKIAKGYEITEEDLNTYLNPKRKLLKRVRVFVFTITTIAFACVEFFVNKEGLSFNVLQVLPPIVWLLTLFTLLRQRNPVLHGRLHSWYLLTFGLCAFFAFSGIYLTYTAIQFEYLLSDLSLPSDTFEAYWHFLRKLAPYVCDTLISQVFIVFISALTYIITSNVQFSVHYTNQPLDRPWAWLKTLPALFLLALLWGANYYAIRYHSEPAHITHVKQLVSMIPLQTEDRSSHKFYIDKNLSDITQIQNILPKRILQSKHMPSSELDSASLISTLQMGQSIHRACLEGVRYSLKNQTPTPCLTGIEAQMACALRGMRLPTRHELDAATQAGLLDLYPLEWTRRVVQNKEEYSVYVPHKDKLLENKPELLNIMHTYYPHETKESLEARWEKRFSELKLDQFRENVYFRCVYSP